MTAKTGAIHSQNCQTTAAAAADIRPGRKCFSSYGYLFALILLLGLGAQQAWARPDPNDELLPPSFADNDEEFGDVDNLEIHHVKFVDGHMEADHPIIMYKEDFVDENYVPSKNGTRSHRRYKDITHRRRHKTTTTTTTESPTLSASEETKTEKIYFDFVPETPIHVADDLEKPKKTHIKLVPLLEAEEGSDGSSNPTKDELQKRPKKFHRRIRRNAGAEGEHVVRKRNPFFRQIPKSSSDMSSHHVHTGYVYIKHAVPGKKHNALDIPVTKRPSTTTEPQTPISFDNRVAADENDRVIFSSGRRTTARPRPRSTLRPTEGSIFRDPSPENYDFSFMNQGQGSSANAPATTPGPIYTRRPATRAPESIFRDPSPENFDFSFMNNRPSGQSSSGSAAPARPVTSMPPSGEAGISQCVWAIVNCCSNRDSEIRYSCFEQNGCHSAFWGLNPCAENVRDSFVNYVADYYN